MSIASWNERTLILDQNEQLWVLGNVNEFNQDLFADEAQLETGGIIRRLDVPYGKVFAIAGAIVIDKSFKIWNFVNNGWRGIEIKAKNFQVVYVSGSYNPVVLVDSDSCGWVVWTHRNAPYAETFATQVVSVSSGDGFILLLDKFGSVYAKGDNSHGQLSKVLRLDLQFINLTTLSC
jgi:hypothetical protein